MKKNSHLISKLYHFTALCKFTLKNSDGRRLRSLFYNWSENKCIGTRHQMLLLLLFLWRKKTTRHTFFRFKNFYVKTYKNPPFSFKGSPLTEIVLVAQDCGGSLVLVPPRAVIRSSAGKSASDDHITKTKSIAWTYYMMYIEGAPLMLVILLMQYYYYMDGILTHEFPCLTFQMLPVISTSSQITKTGWCHTLFVVLFVREITLEERDPENISKRNYFFKC